MQEIKIISAYRQSLKTRILEAASDAFSQKGIKSVRMDDIAQSLNISKRTLYEIYENKEVLLFECLKTSKARAQEEMTFIAAQQNNVMDIILDIYRSKMSQLQKINPQFYSDLEKYPQLQSFLEEQHDKDRTKLKDFLRRGIEEGYFKGDINVDIIANVFDAIYNPYETALVKRAKANGSKAEGGMSMLVWQAVVAHEHWDGSAYDKEDIDRLCEDAAKELLGR